ncbi:hypothetical protein [Acinetobacter tianfuensis]|uniref:Uncharacterized protein n=1 Tax=Acinetobacter tianfuensis TaxID=2419603 RepID=A0A3A8EC86_9GAMM|nr:hypothetical protein [Acinetobacter tianfuensis]RKG32255.1 hypothetical protein D7V32_06200 [Acinetobacter tianfuensis]
MDKREFHLKRSLMALLFQFGIFAIFMTILYQLLPVGLWCVFLAAGLMIYALYFRKKPRVKGLEYLDGRDWTLTSMHQTRRVQISHIIDHQVYIVVYFQHARAKPIIIWCDQLPLKQWKALKVLAKMI